MFSISSFEIICAGIGSVDNSLNDLVAVIKISFKFSDFRESIFIIFFSCK